jgi:hypothetical protein
VSKWLRLQSWTPARTNVSHQAVVVPAKKKTRLDAERGTHKINCAATILSQDSGFVQITFFNDWFAVLVSAVFAARVRDSENFLPIGFSADFALSVAFSARRKARVWPGRGDAA